MADVVVGAAAGKIDKNLGKIATITAEKAKLFTNAASGASKQAANATTQVQAKAAANSAKSYSQKAATENLKKNTAQALNSQSGKTVRAGYENILKDETKEARKIE